MKHILKHWSLSDITASQPTPKKFLTVKEEGGGTNENADGTNVEKGLRTSPQVSTFLPVHFVLCSAPAMRRNSRVRKVGIEKIVMM